MTRFLVKDLVKTNVSCYNKSDNWEYINYLDTGNLTNNVISEVVKLIPGEDTIPSRAKRKVKQGDILYSTVRPNQCHFGYMKNLLDNMIVSTGYAVLEPLSDKICGKYLYYYLTQREIVEYLHSIAEGTVSTYPSIQPKDIEKISIDMPDLDEQKAIASVLSTYDDLIEKNNRKIEILQDMAEELYKEWFVRFRFPGYKTAKFTDGIPDGWEVDRIESLGVFTRGKNITASEMIDGSIPVISAGIEPSGFHNESNVKGVSITISSSGANAGYMCINYSDIWAADCMYVNNIDNVFYLYELLNNIRPCIDNLQRGAAQPHVYSKDVNRLKILLPAEEVRNKFNDLVKDMHLSIATLMKQNNNLKQQRDLLLPRLMSGKLEVKVS